MHMGHWNNDLRIGVVQSSVFPGKSHNSRRVLYIDLKDVKQNNNNNKGNAKGGESSRLKIWPGDLDLWHMKINRVPDSIKN